jgi:hypothetical protein
VTDPPTRTTSMVLCCFGLICASALVGAVVVVSGIADVTARDPHDALPASADTVRSLLGHNALVALWPLGLVLIGWPGLRGTALVGDVLVGAQLVSHGYFLGALVAVQPDVWRFLPHLPVEWFALALPAAAWWAARRSKPALGELVRFGASCIAALVVAALIETYAVPVT